MTDFNFCSLLSVFCQLFAARRSPPATPGRPPLHGPTLVNWLLALLTATAGAYCLTRLRHAPCATAAPGTGPTNPPLARESDAAEALILGRGYSLTEISDLLGYSSYSYFSRVYKKYKHCLPGETSRQVTASSSALG